MDTADLRQQALAAIDGVHWIPAWGRDRIHNMVALRPDWCISRQRSWGVPIPAVNCTACQTPILTTDLVERASQVFDQYGADAWYERPMAEFVPGSLTCPNCGGRAFDREHDILDVWFDSGSSHEAVLPADANLTWPADMYLEGSDQHRGWFHSSLLIGLGTRGTAPFKQVLTHGFVVDEQGRKMSKSLGNTVAPQDVIAQSGAEILRLWVSMVDYGEEVRLGPEILARVVEAYRKFRNVLRVLLGNLFDFDRNVDAVPPSRMLEIDRWVMARYAGVVDKVLKAYDQYDYLTIHQVVNAFITVDLSAFYVDITKDRMYTLGAKSEARRSGQTAMFIIVDGLARLLAPITSVHDGKRCGAACQATASGRCTSRYFHPISPPGRTERCRSGGKHFGPCETKSTLSLRMRGRRRQSARTSLHASISNSKVTPSRCSSSIKTFCQRCSVYRMWVSAPFKWALDSPGMADRWSRRRLMFVCKRPTGSNALGAGGMYQASGRILTGPASATAASTPSQSR